MQPDVLRFQGREALSEPFIWDIEFTTPQSNTPPEQVLMKYASLRMRSGKHVHGIITRLEWLSTSADQSHYRLTLSPRLALLSHTRQCAVFHNQSVTEVVEQVLRQHGLEGADFEFRLERTYPPRELITQWRETDLQFIQRLLSKLLNSFLICCGLIACLCYVLFAGKALRTGQTGSLSALRVATASSKPMR